MEIQVYWKSIEKPISVQEQDILCVISFYNRFGRQMGTDFYQTVIDLLLAGF